MDEDESVQQPGEKRVVRRRNAPNWASIPAATTLFKWLDASDKAELIGRRSSLQRPSGVLITSLTPAVGRR